MRTQFPATLLLSEKTRAEKPCSNWSEDLGHRSDCLQEAMNRLIDQLGLVQVGCDGQLTTPVHDRNPIAAVPGANDTANLQVSACGRHRVGRAVLRRLAVEVARPCIGGGAVPENVAGILPGPS